MLKKVVGHFCTITKHKIKVFGLCCRAGIPFRGFMHDWSKFSPTEFWESVKYYSGKKSPIGECIHENGYSAAWLHHKGRNKHHYQYWYDENIPNKMPVIPYKYVVEMICDNLAAGMTYLGKNWTKEYQLNYWMGLRTRTVINPVIDQVLIEVFSRVAKDGIKPVIKKKVLTEIYDRAIVECSRRK